MTTKILWLKFSHATSTKKVMFVKKWPLEYQKVLKPTFLPTYETVVTVVTIDCLQTVLSLYIDERRGVQENTSIRSREFPLVTFFTNFLLSHKVVNFFFCQQLCISQTCFFSKTFFRVVKVVTKNSVTKLFLYLFIFAHRFVVT